MKFKDNFFENYVQRAPLPLAIERTFECSILSKRNFQRPILDVGCGDGIFAQCLFDELIDVGIDPDLAEIDRAKQINAYSELICCSGNAIPKEDGHFKTIFSNSVMEHIADIKAVLVECRRVLSKDGCAYITVPTDRFEEYTVFYQVCSFLGLKGLALRFGRFFNSFWKHEHHYDRGGWEELFKDCGFAVSDCREYNPKSSCLLNDFLIPFSLLSFLSRKFAKRWFYSPQWRKIYSNVLSNAYNGAICKNLDETKACGLIFFKLEKG